MYSSFHFSEDILNSMIAQDEIFLIAKLKTQIGETLQLASVNELSLIVSRDYNKTFYFSLKLRY